MLKKTICSVVCLGLVFGHFNAFAQTPTAIANSLYQAAANGDMKYIKSLKKQGFSIEQTDANGNTALCLAMLNNNQKAYKTLLKVGASKNAQCAKSIYAQANASAQAAANPDQMIYLNGGLSETPYGEAAIVGSSSSSFWTAGTMATAGLLVAGGAGIAALAIGGGGGGGGSSNKPEDITGVEVPSCLGGTWRNKNGAQVCECPTGKSLVNGACVESKEEYQTKSVTNDGTKLVTKEDDALLAELGASATNSGIITGQTTGEKLVGIKVNGFSSAAYSGTLTPDTKLNSGAASNGVNTGTIHLTQSSATGGELYGIMANGGAIASNEKDATITLDVVANKSAYGIFGEYESTGIKNDGTINLNLSQNAFNAYGLYAPDRNLINNGTILTTVLNPNFTSALTGEVAALYGSSLQNNGTIQLKRGEATGGALNETNLNFYGMYAEKGGAVENTKDGSILLNVTKNPFYNYGIFADRGTSGITNKGRIEILGQLASKVEEGKAFGGAYGIRFVGGYGSIVNEGVIETRKYIEETKSYEKLTLTGNAYLALLKGFKGSIDNNADLNLYLDNKVTDGLSRWTISAIDLEGDNQEGKGVVNNADINIDIGTGNIKSGWLTGIRGLSTTVENKGNIYISSAVDNLDLAGLYADTKDSTLTNAQYSIIKIDGAGANTALYGMVSNGGDALNSGSVILTHKADGLMQGAGGKNSSTGKIQLIADPTVDTMQSMQAYGISGNYNEGEISISMRKGSFGEVIGMAFSEATGYDSENSGTISIALENRTERGFGRLTGIQTDDTSSDHKSTTNSGLISINAMTQTNNNQALIGDLVGIQAYGKDIKNEAGAKIDLQLNGEGTIIGMLNIAKLNDGEQTPQFYNNINDGTISIKAINTTHSYNINIRNLSLPKSYTPDTSKPGSWTELDPDGGETTIPFDIVGMISNSYAENNGNILLDVSGGAKVAGMIAYNGAIAVNRGLIEFKGNVDNFLALGAIGSRTIKNVTATEEPDVDSEGKPVYDENGKAKTHLEYSVVKTIQYSSVYNYGRIKVNETEYGGSENPSDLVQASDEGLVADVDKRKNSNTYNQVVESGEGTSYPPTLKRDETNYIPGEASSDSKIKTTTTSSSLNGRKIVLLNNGVNYYSENKGVIDAGKSHVVGYVFGGTSLVMDENKDLYVSAGDGDGAVIGDGDTTDLLLDSASAMFNASWRKNATNDNGLDIVMTRKSFTDLTGNKSLAGFLEANYAAGNNEKFFNQLKAIDSVAAFGSSLTDLTGQNTIARFAVEDLSAMREINFTMNKAMFQNAENDHFETVGLLNGFAFKNNNASGGSYALASKKIAQNWKIGYAMSNTNLSTDDSEGTTRRNQMFNVFMPMGYERFGVRLISTPQIGFARGHYTRSEFEGGAYKGVVEKRTFALMNEARYPIRFGKMTIEPAVEFNAIAYNQRGHEDKKAYALTMPSDTNVSIESGVGLYALKDTQIGYEGRLSISAGLMMYREFADPYNIKMGMDGMSGSFNLYNERSPYRAVASFGLSYDIGGANMYGSVQHFMETDTHTTAKAGIKVGF